MIRRAALVALLLVIAAALSFAGGSTEKPKPTPAPAVPTTITYTMVSSGVAASPCGSVHWLVTQSVKKTGTSKAFTGSPSVSLTPMPLGGYVAICTLPTMVVINTPYQILIRADYLFTSVDGAGPTYQGLPWSYPLSVLISLTP